MISNKIEFARIPHFLFLEITNECNLKCKLCKYWQNIITCKQLITS